MTKLLDQAFEAMRKMPAPAQDAVARYMLDEIVADDLSTEDLSMEDLAALEEGEAQAARGMFASEEQITAAFRRFDP